MEFQNRLFQVKDTLLALQDSICRALVVREARVPFSQHPWTRSAGGGGITCILENGACFEKAGVNFSHVLGECLPPSATLKRPELAGASFEAVGLSLVLHPDNPFAPTTHLNLRYFLTHKNGVSPIGWFGGGFDLTPYYGFEEDCIYWHTMAQKACQPFGEDLYPRFKKACDDYFYLPHRQEPRGIGGLFFDDLNEWDFDTCFAFIKSVGEHFLKAYLPILDKRQDTPYTEKNKYFQRMRRGRYVEFNLLYDRGTLFGLQSGGRVESILMSLPPEVVWTHEYQVMPGSLEEKLYTDFLKPKAWV